MACGNRSNRICSAAAIRIRPIAAVITLSRIGVVPERVGAISTWISAEAVPLASSLSCSRHSLEDRTKTPRAVVAMRIIGEVDMMIIYRAEIEPVKG